MKTKIILLSLLLCGCSTLQKTDTIAQVDVKPIYQLPDLSFCQELPKMTDPLGSVEYIKLLKYRYKVCKNLREDSVNWIKSNIK